MSSILHSLFRPLVVRNCRDEREKALFLLTARRPLFAAVMKLVILDRDGVINYDSDAYIKTPDEWRAIPGSIEAIARLSLAGYTVCVATNQAALGRGRLTLAMLEAIHYKMYRVIEAARGHITRVVYCPHTPEANCNCRKPRPGLLLQIGREFGIPLDEIPFIGDSQKDLDAAASVGAHPILVRTGNGRKTEAMGKLPAGTRVFDDLASATGALLDAIEQ